MSIFKLFLQKILTYLLHLPPHPPNLGHRKSVLQAKEGEA